MAKLAEAQRPDGHWSDGLSDTSLALLAFAAAGYETSVEPYARTVRLGIVALLSREAEWGLDVRRLALVAAALSAIQGQRGAWTPLSVPLERARAALLERRLPDGTWGDSAVTLWARLSWHSPFVAPREPLVSDAPEHQAFMARYGGDLRAWASWLGENRPRLLKETEGVEATARRVIEIAAPYRFYRFSARGTRASTSGLSSAGRLR